MEKAAVMIGGRLDFRRSSESSYSYLMISTDPLDNVSMLPSTNCVAWDEHWARQRWRSIPSGLLRKLIQHTSFARISSISAFSRAALSLSDLLVFFLPLSTLVWYFS